MTNSEKRHFLYEEKDIYTLKFWLKSLNEFSFHFLCVVYTHMLNIEKKYTEKKYEKAKINSK